MYKSTMKFYCKETFIHLLWKVMVIDLWFACVCVCKTLLLSSPLFLTKKVDHVTRSERGKNSLTWVWHSLSVNWERFNYSWALFVWYIYHVKLYENRNQTRPHERNALINIRGYVDTVFTCLSLSRSLRYNSH